jgi:hypothetical protein
MSFKAAFVFICPGNDPAKHRTAINTPEMDLFVVGVKTYDEADKAVSELLAQGVTAFELCAGFGAQGVARINRVVGDKASVGVVRFDIHPALDFKSGDAFFG